MRLAQQLYEGIDIKGNGTVGVISYLRTDSPESQRKQMLLQENISLLSTERIMFQSLRKL